MALNTIPVTIQAGQSVSDPVDCTGSARIVRLVMPPGWTKAPLTFCMSPDNTVYHDLYHVAPGTLESYEVTLPVVTPNAVVAFPPTTGAVVTWFRIRSGTHALPIVQPAARTFQVVVEVLDQTTGEGGVGVEGPTGPAGVQGPTGAVGPAGTVGSTGAAGVAGPTGAQGSAGPTGATGTSSLKGVVDGSDAVAGNAGEFLAANNTTGVPLTTVVTANVTNLALPAGDWNVNGIVIFTPSGTGPNSVIAAVSTVTATLPTDNQVLAGGASMFQAWSSAMPSGKVQTIPVGMCRFSLSAPATVYLVAQSSFGGGSVTVTGRLTARRAR